MHEIHSGQGNELLCSLDTQGLPLIGHFEITKKCPYQCGFCYSSRRDKTEMSLDQIKRLIGEFADEGCLHINLSGGEPLAHRNFIDIYSFIIASGIKVSLETTASILPDHILAYLVKYPPERVLVSMYANSDRTQEMVTKSKVRIDTVRQNILKLHSSGIRTLVRTLINKDNVDEIHEIKRFAESIGVGYGWDSKVWWSQCGKRMDSYRCDSASVARLLGIDPVYEKILRSVLYLESASMRSPSRCGWGRNEFYVNPYGELHRCVVFWADVYDLLAGSFKDAWHNWYKVFEQDSVCAGRHVFDTNGECPSAYIYQHQEIIPSKSLLHYMKQDHPHGGFVAQVGR